MREGETYIHGMTPELARTLLTAAEAVGLSPLVVQTSDGSGFIVPDAVWDEAESRLSAPAPEERF